MTKQITITFLERQGLKEGQIMWRGDPACPGLRVRLSTSKTRGRSVTWYYRYKQNGKLITPQKIGEYPSMSLDDARQVVVNKLRPMARAGLNVKRERKNQQKTAEAPQTVRELIPGYLDYCQKKGLSEGTVTSYRRYLRPLATWWAEKVPGEMNRGNVQDMFYKVQEVGVPPFDIDGKPLKGGRTSGGHRAAGLTHAAGRGFWTWLVDRELAPYNIWKEQTALSKAGQSGIAERALDNNEIKVLLASDALDQRDNTILRFLLGTGLRPNEVCGAEWSEIDLKAGVWVVPSERMKFKGKDHKVALSEYVVDLLTQWSKTQRGRPRYVFPSSGSRYAHVVPDNLVERFKKLGVDGFSPKVCRSTFRTGLQALGCPKEVRSYMSHHQPADKVSKSCDKYDYGPEAKHWWQQWGIHLAKLEQGKPGVAKAVSVESMAR